MKKNERNAGRKPLYRAEVITEQIRLIVPTAIKIEVIEFVNEKKKPYLWKK